MQKIKKILPGLVGEDDDKEEVTKCCDEDLKETIETGVKASLLWAIWCPNERGDFWIQAVNEAAICVCGKSICKKWEAVTTNEEFGVLLILIPGGYK